MVALGYSTSALRLTELRQRTLRPSSTTLCRMRRDDCEDGQFDPGLDEHSGNTATSKSAHVTIIRSRETVAGTSAQEHLSVAALPDIPEILVQLGLSYWSLDAVDTSGYPKWARSSNDLSATGFGPIHFIAAASVRAPVPSAECNRCGRELIVRTRTDFAGVLAGDATTCLLCDQGYLDSAQRLLAAATAGRIARFTARQRAREAEHQRHPANQLAQTAARAWMSERIRTVARAYPLQLVPDQPIPKTDVVEKIAMLAILRHAPASTTPGLITPVGNWHTPLAADSQRATDMIDRLYHHGLLSIHPTSHPDAFAFTPCTYHEALQAASDNAHAVAPAQLDDSTYYPLSCSFYVPYGRSMGTAIQKLDERFSPRIRPDALDEPDRHKLLTMLADALADEAARYFDFQIEDKNLPPVPEQHRPRLREAARKAAEYMPLGRLYCQAWRAARDAAVVAQRRGLPDHPNMTTHGVKQFERFVADRTQATAGNPFNEATELPLAAITRTLLRTALDMDPMATAVGEVRELFEATPLPDDGSWPWRAAAEDVRRSIDAGVWSGLTLRAELARSHAQWRKVGAMARQAHFAERLIGFYDLYEVKAGARDAALEVVELARLKAGADTDDAPAAQTILLRLADTLAAAARRCAPTKAEKDREGETN